MDLPAWRKASFCQSGECVEVAEQDGMIVMRNSKEHGQVLNFTTGVWKTFVRRIKVGEFGALGAKDKLKRQAFSSSPTERWRLLSLLAGS
jgi:hypothetical protein